MASSRLGVRARAAALWLNLSVAFGSIMVFVYIRASCDIGIQVTRFDVPVNQILVTLMMAWCEYNEIMFHEACFIDSDMHEVHPADEVDTLCNDISRPIIMEAVPRPHDELGRPCPYSAASMGAAPLEDGLVWSVDLTPIASRRAWSIIRTSVPYRSF